MVKGLTADNLEAILTGADPTQPVVIDVRPTSSFIRGHLAGSLSVPYRTGQFVDQLRARELADRPLVVLGPVPELARKAALEAAEAGFPVAGFVDATWATISARPGMTLRSTAVIDTKTLQALYQKGAVQLVDVRLPPDRASGVIPGGSPLAIG